MFSLLAFYANQAIGASLTFLPALADQVYRTTGNGFIVDPAIANLGAVFTRGPTMTRCQVQSPTLRRVLNKEVKPFMTTMPVGDQVAVYDQFMYYPMKLGPNEEIDLLITNTAQDHELAAIILCDGPVKQNTAPDFTARFTGTTTLTADAWTLVPLTSDQTLSPGTYDVVGARCKSAGAIFFRLVFPNQVWRPGWLATQSDLSTYIDRDFRHGMFGILGTFAFNAIPYVEMIADSADTAETVDLDLVYHPASGQ